MSVPSAESLFGVAALTVIAEYMVSAVALFQGPLQHQMVRMGLTLSLAIQPVHGL